MKRIPEQELMDDPLQAQAYAGADFEQPHSMFIGLFQKTFPAFAGSAHVLDLGCGPGDITFRFARAFAQCRVHGVDGSDAMLLLAHKALELEPSLQGRVRFFQGLLPAADLSRTQYGIIISNSLLHHLPDPAVLWKTVKAFAAPQAMIFIMDLKRPASIVAAQQLTDAYAQGEPEVLRRDFYNSLLAAFEIGEIHEQLRGEGLGGLNVQVVSDRNVLVSGRLAG